MLPPGHACVNASQENRAWAALPLPHTVCSSVRSSEVPADSLLRTLSCARWVYRHPPKRPHSPRSEALECVQLAAAFFRKLACSSLYPQLARDAHSFPCRQESQPARWLGQERQRAARTRKLSPYAVREAYSRTSLRTSQAARATFNYGATPFPRPVVVFRAKYANLLKWTS